jgi:hypothetical protein
VIIDPTDASGAAYIADHFPGTDRVGPKLISGRRSTRRTARQMAAIALRWAGTFRRGGSIVAARMWLAEAHGWRTVRHSTVIAPPVST